MDSRKPRPTELSERRRAQRFEVQGKVTLHLHDSELEGVSSNLSRTGVLFFTEEPVRVTVELEEEGVVRRRTGTLVRCERIRGERRGWAVEFDDAG